MPIIVDDIAVAAVAAEAATAATGSAVVVEATTAATGSAMAVEATTAATAIETTTTGTTAAAEASTAASGATATETASATGSIAASEATTGIEVVAENPSIVETPAIEGDFVHPIAENTVDLSDVTFVDEFPSSEVSVKSTEIDNVVDDNLFSDEFPSQSVSETNPFPESTAESLQETDTPKSYEELCETRDSGGSYKDVKNEGCGWNDNPPTEVHHMPADSASNLERGDGPAIAMEYGDHQQTASCGSSREAKEYRAAQKELIEKGDFRGALQMDIDDIHDKFGDKYDKAISQMLDYVDKLEQSGKI